MNKILWNDRNLKEISSAVVRYATTFFVLFLESLMVRSLDSERVHFGTSGQCEKPVIRCPWFIPTFSVKTTSGRIH